MGKGEGEAILNVFKESKSNGQEEYNMLSDESDSEERVVVIILFWKKILSYGISKERCLNVFSSNVRMCLKSYIPYV
jgi:hypothetical protein